MLTKLTVTSKCENSTDHYQNFYDIHHLQKYLKTLWCKEPIVFQMNIILSRYFFVVLFGLTNDIKRKDD